MTDETASGNAKPEQNIANTTADDFIQSRLGAQEAPSSVDKQTTPEAHTESDEKMEQEANPTDVLSQVDLDNMSETELREMSEKLGSRAVARYGELTARRKQAEERMKSMENEIRALKQNKKQAPIVENNPLAHLKTSQELKKQHKSAQEVVQWAEDVLFENEEYGPKDVVTEVDGKEYTKVEVRKMLKNSREMLNKYIPAQAQVLQRNAQIKTQVANFQRKPIEEFDWVKSQKGDVFNNYKKMLTDPRIKNLQKTDPVVSAQMPYILAHAAQNMFGRKAVSEAKVPQTEPPKRQAPTSARPARRPSANSKQQKEVAQRFASSGDPADFIALRTLQHKR